MVKSIYLDYAASAEPNPSSIHELGVLAKKNLEAARQKVAAVLNARPEEIIFSSGGTEGNNLAIQGLVFAEWKQNFVPHVITTNIEHPSVLETCRMLERRGLAQISIVPVEPNGVVDPKKIKKEIKPDTVLISIMYANNEIGTVQPIKEIAREIRHYRKQNKTSHPYFHTDAVQAVNFLDLNVEKLGVDMLTLSGSKISGAGRVGVLYKKRIVPLAPVFGGGDQEGGLRPGTENLPAIIKFSTALAVAQKNKDKETKRFFQLRDYFIASLLEIFSSCALPSGGNLGDKKFQGATPILNGDMENSLPNIVSVTFPKIPSDLLVIELSARGVMCSSKSACKSSRAEGSYVIQALRPEADTEIGALRFSLGADTSKKDIDYTLKALAQILQKTKKWYN